MGRFIGPPASIGIVSGGIFGVQPQSSGTWVLRTAYPLAAVKTLAGNSTRVVVLDGLGHVAYSDDKGATWTTGTGLSSIDGAAIATNGTNLWVASSSGGDIYTSPTGATWTFAVTLPLQGAPSIVFGGGLWVLTAQSSAQVVDVYTSSNGTSWTGQGTATPNQMAVQLYDGTDFVSSAQTAGGGPSIAFSTNAAAWSNISTPQFLPNNNVIVIAFHAGNYVATDQDFPSVVQKSPTAMWAGTNITQPLTNDVQGVAFGDGVWCLVGDVSGGTIPQAATSTDLVHWTLEDLKMGAAGFGALAGVQPAAGTLFAWTNNNLLSSRL